MNEIDKDLIGHLNRKANPSDYWAIPLPRSPVPNASVNSATGRDKPVP
ncbi:MAG: hypothetical protein OXK76_01970 [Gammaproteobacteria bacterium]|nr:hypothetical protein [Gammaproteobacteria bacterium]